MEDTNVNPDGTAWGTKMDAEEAQGPPKIDSEEYQKHRQKMNLCVTDLFYKIVGDRFQVEQVDGSVIEVEAVRNEDNYVVDYDIERVSE